VDAPDAVQLADLRAMAERLRAESSEVQRFAAAALGQIERLTALVQEVHRSADASPDHTARADDRSQRLQDLVIEQAATIELRQAALDRVRALCDLSEWSASTTDASRDDATVRVSDVLRALDRNQPDDLTR
jgi:anti-sigma factor ChrR (cupin superfamily)